MASYTFKYGVLLSVEGEKLLLDYVSDYFGQTRTEGAVGEKQKKALRYDVVG